MKSLPLVLLCLLALPPAARAGADWGKELEPAARALGAADYRGARARYLDAAGHGNPLAQFMLGLFEQNGWGRAPDPVAACGWFEQAAQKRIPAAEHGWAGCLAQGIGRPADVPAALAWYEKAAGDGHLISKCDAADYYVAGRGVEKDVAKGLAMCTEIAQANSPPAMLKLAHWYRNGDDVPQNLAAARAWYAQAAERGILEAQYWLGMMLARGEGGQADATAARNWLETAASQGYAPAYLPTAELYANAPPQPDTGALAPEDLAKVYLWTAAAKARASDDAQRARIARIEALLNPVVPPGWRPELDRKVAAHLTRYPAP